MAAKPTPDRSDLESKTREDLQTIAKVKGVEVSARASKAALIVFDDIRWSDSMADGWKRISSDTDVMFNAEIGGMGFVGL